MALPLDGAVGSTPTPTMSLTPADLCRRAMMSIGRLGANQPFDGDDLDVCMTSLNDLIDAWKINDLLLECEARAGCGLRSGVYQYSIGPSTGAVVTDLAVPFAPQIWWGSLILDFASGARIERSLGPPRSLREFPPGVGVGSIATDFPDRFFYQPTFGSTAGYGTLFVYPTPNNNRHQLIVWYPHLLDRFAGPHDVVALRPGLARALRTNLAMEIAPMFNAEPSGDLRRQAKAAYDAIQIVGGHPNELTFDRGLLPRRQPYNLYADEWSQF